MVKGKLYLCGTPIGNLEDITLRALKVLQDVDYIGAEDTRHTRKLLSHFNIKGRLFSCYTHNEKSRRGFIEDKLDNGLNVALVSSAGMPGISDPGNEIVLDLLSKGYELEVIPGVSAVTTAMAISGFWGNEFYFAGFLPRPKGLRRKKIEQLQGLAVPIVIFESPLRLIETLKEFIAVWGDMPQVVLTRELTKLHQEIIRDSLGSLLKTLEGRDAVQGEITFIIDGRTVDKPVDDGEDKVKDLAKALLESGVSNSDIVQLLQKIIDWPRNKLYDYVLNMKDKGY